MHILVTGGAGFIGSNFVLRTLERTDHTLTVLDAMTYAANPTSLVGFPEERLRLVKASVTDEDTVNDLVAQADLVVHFAAESHNDRSLRSPLDFVRTNVEGTAVLLAAAVRHKVRFHHISTDEVFGDLALEDPERFRPDTPYRPSSPYSASKAASDHLVRAWVRSFGLEATISNCSNNYGPRQHPEKFIPRQILNLLGGEPPRVYGTGRNVRDWIHVDDHNDAVWAIIERGTPGETYLIGADGERSNMEVVRELNRIFDRDPDDFLHVTDRPGHDRRYAIDPSSTRALGWAPAHADFARGLRETVEWYRENPRWWGEAFAASESNYRRGERQFPH
ncbi:MULTISPECIES: dTDP-glucose 4,6-dehydratase [unclassified Corynebacterium]|uniref:dTDP-glucose 4,6-dehydratase n=1 Tax=unclassified Corynebacterium TaxID=2624378 RepID=UPI0029C9E147|nr:MULTISPECIES: dTDP-glucose 4,6-dehydratase [unclassified Corynebacterium]WPF66422.1 dTDP-glucose 4,6-dehydratase [Corynebacterium sp. 22KM0430]WPF68912.1 dTDP-glucose 4,6-dehydratase [Corynebacterium sp. 21KM1197]